MTEAKGASSANPASVSVVCRCEEIVLEDILSSIEAGATTLNDVKRWTRAGMGLCQGIFCMPAIAGMVARETGLAVERVAPLTARAPVRPIPLEALADLVDNGRPDERSRSNEEDQP